MGSKLETTMGSKLETFARRSTRPAIGGAIGLAAGIAYWFAWGCHT